MNTWLNEKSSSWVVVLIFILSGGHLGVLRVLRCNLYSLFAAPFAQAHLDSMFLGILSTTFLQDVSILAFIGIYVGSNANEIDLVILFTGVSSLVAAAQ